MEEQRTACVIVDRVRINGVLSSGCGNADRESGDLSERLHFENFEM
jgi:hypothetical protein